MFPEVHLQVSLNCSSRSLKPVTRPCWFVACNTLPFPCSSVWGWLVLFSVFPSLFLLPTMPASGSRGDRVDLLVQHRPPWRERGLWTAGSDPLLLQGEGLRTAHGHGGSDHRLGGSRRYWGSGALQSGERFLVHQQGAAQWTRVLQLPRPLSVSLR